MEALNIGGRHLGNVGIQRGLDEDVEEEYKLGVFSDDNNCVAPCVYVSA